MLSAINFFIYVYLLFSQIIKLKIRTEMYENDACSVEAPVDFFNF